MSGVVVGRGCRDLGTPTTLQRLLTRVFAAHGSRMDYQGSHQMLCRAYNVVACNVYVSEGKDRSVIDKIVQSIGNDDSEVAKVGHVFVDASYNRTGVTLVGRTSSAIAQGAVGLSRTALELIDLRNHYATHPRLGVVDHISCHPLVNDDVGMGLARDAAREIARSLGEDYGVPTYVYGTASCDEQKASLASIRRMFGYFKPQRVDGRAQVWKGACIDEAIVRAHPPAFGPQAVPPEWGIACVGSVPWVVNHNVVLNTHDVAVAKDIAKRVSERGGGLKAVQAMGLEVESGVEVACNLLDSSVSDASRVDDFIAKVGKEEYGVQVVTSYQTGKTVEELQELK